jgi:hypothetical protein
VAHLVIDGPAIAAAVVCSRRRAEDTLTFDSARRRLVGRLHLSPPLKFTDEATYSAEARAAVEALAGTGRLPQVTGLSSEQVEYALLADSSSPIPPDRAPALTSDELAALALRTIRPRTDAAARDVRLAIRDLTGQVPSAADCQQVAAEIGLRAGPGVTTTVAQRARSPARARSARSPLLPGPSRAALSMSFWARP